MEYNLDINLSHFFQNSSFLNKYLKKKKKREIPKPNWSFWNFPCTIRKNLFLFY